MAGIQAVWLTSKVSVVSRGRSSARPRSRGAVVCSCWDREKSVPKLAVSAALAWTLAVSVPDAQAGLFGGEKKDPIEPFSIFGTVYKQYVIDILDDSGRAIVGRTSSPQRRASICSRQSSSATACRTRVGSGAEPRRSGEGRRTRFCEKRVVKGSIPDGTDDARLRPSVPLSVLPGHPGVRRTATQEQGFGFTDKGWGRSRGRAARCEKECIKPGKSYASRFRFGEVTGCERGQSQPNVKVVYLNPSFLTILLCLNRIDAIPSNLAFSTIKSSTVPQRFACSTITGSFDLASLQYRMCADGTRLALAHCSLSYPWP